MPISREEARARGWARTAAFRGNAQKLGYRLAPTIGSSIVRTELEECESLFVVAEKQPYLVDGCANKVLRISGKDEAFAAFLAGRYGLLRSEGVTRQVVDYLVAYALNEAPVRPLKRWSHFDKDAGALYVSRYDGTAWKLDGSAPEIVPNGQGALFLDDEGGIPCPEAIPAPGGGLFERLVDDVAFTQETSAGLTPAAQRNALAIWLLALGFADLFPTKPILLVEGEKGSGKTLAIQRIQHVLTGKSTPLIVSHRPNDDFGVQILRECPAILLDNVDSSIDWLKDALASYATCGLWRRRKLFSDMDQIDIRPTGFLAVASRNPSTLRRDDLADRLLILRVERRTEFRAAEAIFRELDALRPALLGEWLWQANRIVAQLKMPAPEAGAYRMADLSRFAYAAGPAVLGIASTEVAVFLQAAQDERDALVLEEEPLADLLDVWLDNRTNEGRELKLAELMGELNVIAAMKLLQPYTNPKSFAARFRNLRAALGRQFEIRARVGSGKTTLYRFRRQPEAPRAATDEA